MTGTSWHVTAKSSIRIGSCFINPALTHRELRILPREVCHMLSQPLATDCSAEARVIEPDRMAEVSRGHSSSGQPG